MSSDDGTQPANSDDPPVHMMDAWMPDKTQFTPQMLQNKQYIILDGTEQAYRQSVANLHTIFLSCGAGSATPPPDAGAVPQVPEMQDGNQLYLFQNYAALAQKLQDDWNQLWAINGKIPAAVKKIKEISRECQDSINNSIRELNGAAYKLPPDGLSLNDVMMANAEKMSADATAALTKAIGDGAGPKGTITQADLDAAVNGQKSKDDTANKAMIDDLNKHWQGIVDGLKGSYPPPVGATGPLGLGATGSGTYVSPFDGATGDLGNGDLGATGSGNTGGTGSSGNSDITDKLQSVIDSLQNSANQNTATQASNPLSSMLGDSSILPSLLNSMMNRGSMDSDLANRRDQLATPSVYQTPQPMPVSQTPAAAEAATRPVPPAPPVSPPGATGPSSTQPTATPPAPKPDSDQGILYHFDDGRTQMVSAVVKQALDAARANKDGTDAQAAYAQTSAKWPDTKHIGDPVDPNQLMTGDVATWDNRTAIVVIFPPDQANPTGSMEVMVGGKLQPFTPEISDKQGDFGQFDGFAHPHGIELPAGVAAPAGGVVPIAADHPAAAPHALAAPGG